MNINLKNLTPKQIALICQYCDLHAHLLRTDPASFDGDREASDDYVAAEQQHDLLEPEVARILLTAAFYQYEETGL